MEGEKEMGEKIQSQITNYKNKIENLKRGMHIENMDAILDSLVQSLTGHKFDLDDVTIDLDQDCGDQRMLEFCQYDKCAATCPNNGEKHRLLLKQYQFYKNLHEKLRKMNEERKRKLSSLMNKQDELCSILNETKYEIENRK